MKLSTMFAYFFIGLNIYFPINAWVSHEAGIATPLSYIGLGFSLYFWLLNLIQILTPKEDRKIYSEKEMQEIMLTAVDMLEIKEDTKH